MDALFGTAALAGLGCAAYQLLFALTGLGTQLFFPFVLACPLARPVLGVNAVLMAAMSLAILKRHRRGLLLYLLGMGYNPGSALYFLWYAGRLALGIGALWACVTVLMLGYGYLSRGWFGPKPVGAG